MVVLSVILSISHSSIEINIFTSSGCVYKLSTPVQIVEFGETKTWSVRGFRAVDRMFWKLSCQRLYWIKLWFNEATELRQFCRVGVCASAILLFGRPVVVVRKVSIMENYVSSVHLVNKRFWYQFVHWLPLHHPGAENVIENWIMSNYLIFIIITAII